MLMTKEVPVSKIDFKEFTLYMFGKETPPDFSLTMVTGSGVRFLIKEAELYFQSIERETDLPTLLYFIGDFFRYVANNIPDKEA